MGIDPPVPARRFQLVCLAGSAGGIEAIKTILSGLPADFPLPIAIVQHRTSRPPLLLAHVLARRTALHVRQAVEGDKLDPGTVYIAPPDRHLTVKEDLTVAFEHGPKIRHVRSSANPLFESAAQRLKGGVIAVVLSGYDSDGTDGVQAVNQSGGLVIAQDPASALHLHMPRAAIASGAVHHIVPLHEIANELLRLSKLPAAPAAQPGAAGKPRSPMPLS